MGLREQRRRRTEQQIRETAYRLFREHGYDDTTVDMIAAAAGISPRTFFRYFASKHGVLAHLGSNLVERTLENLPRSPSVIELVHELATAFDASLDDEDFRQATVLFRQTPHLVEQVAVWRERWARQLAEGLAPNRPPTLSQRVAATVAVHTVAVCADEWLHRPPTTRLSELVDYTARRLFAPHPPA